MNKAVISNRIYLNRTKDLHDSLINELTYTLPPKRPGGPSESLCEVTRINNNILTIPVGRTDLIPKDYEVVDKRINKIARFPAFKHTLRDSQESVVNGIEGSCLIIANPSWGKTFTGIAIAAKLKQKTLIIVHTKILLEQWRKEVKHCLGIDSGIIGDSKYNIDSPITVATVQSLRNRIHELSSEFGLIIVDEAHHTPASVFKSIVDKFKSMYRIALTATKWRKDGMHVVMNDYFGFTEFNPPDENRLDPEILVVKSGLKLNSNSSLPWQIRLNELYDDPSYMELILNLSEIQASRGHKVLTVCDRIQFLKDCADALNDFMLIIGETSDRDFLKSNKLGILGMQKIFAEGVNIPILSSLILGTPINNDGLLEQLIGRVSRKCVGKKTPEVIDIMLECRTGKNQFAQRMNFYTNAGLKVRYI